VYILHKKLRFKVSLKISEIRHAVRALTTYFFSNLIIPTILTSSKMDRTTIRQHITRAREIHRYLTHTANPYL
jgi:ABC-type iron transport system FetAB ATPase subunit